ncbi:F-box protein [Symbiodinium microadriaticum]|uniref:F-box protein n=1 Tax=Symbiodinium microadriaticum TaxID=2951 RepID=A0A1Q9CK26_SYMMI|nr:F-box protein [Symbiodinium microadriaticum]
MFMPPVTYEFCLGKAPGAHNVPYAPVSIPIFCGGRYAQVLLPSHACGIVAIGPWPAWSTPLIFPTAFRPWIQARAVSVAGPQGSGEDFGRRALPSPAMATSSHRARRLAGVVRMGGCFCAGCCGAAVLFALVGRLDLGFTSGPPESFRGAGRNRHGPGRTERHCVVETSPSELDAVVRAGGSVVLDVYAVWCGPCKLLEPALHKLAGRLSSGEFDEPGIPSPQVLRLDSDRHSTKATALGVEGLPTVIFYKHGVETGRFEGSVSLSQLEDAAAAALGMVELLDDTGLATEVSSLEELELTVQMEDVLMLGVLGSGHSNNHGMQLTGFTQHRQPDRVVEPVASKLDIELRIKRSCSAMDWARPQLFRGAARSLFPANWTLSSIADTYADVHIAVQRLPTKASQLCRSAPRAETLPVKGFFDEMQAVSPDRLSYWSSQVLYEPPFDCLLNDFQRPDFLTKEDDFLTRWRGLRFLAPPLLQFIFYFRWLFIGPKGSYSRLHLDPVGSAAWNACLEGQKRFVFFEPELLHDLHVDLSNPDQLRHIYPEYLADASILRHPYQELVLDAGDVVYAPPRWPHFVENLETSVSVTENFVRCHPDQFACFDFALASSEDSSAELPALEKRRLKRFRRIIRCAASFDGILQGGKWEQDSAALDGTLQILRRQLGGQMQVLTLDASSLPGVAESLQLGDLPAVVIFQDGQKVMHLEGRDAAAANVDDLQDVLEDVVNGMD